ncbi:hypothetical protein KCP69_25370 [Salmonella enterica subsp. enterica]|nr:hypothetical protein KCP69_25370 [Salmonella enterica subsp. enterica]
MKEIIRAHDGHNLNVQLERALLTLGVCRTGDAKSLKTVRRRAPSRRCAVCCWKSRTCCCRRTLPTTPRCRICCG